MVLALSAMACTICVGDPVEIFDPLPPEPTRPEPTRDEPPAPPPPPLPTEANLSLGEVRVEPYSDSFFTYQIVATIVNEGNSTASGFNAGCTYECPPGDTVLSAGLDIVQGGYIEGNSQFVYRSPFHYMCTSQSPSLNLTCTIESAQGSVRTYYKTVTLP
jgi:hypothetical protein